MPYKQHQQIKMLSFHISRFCLSQSQGSRREREFCSLNLEFRDENEIFLSISQGSRRDRDIFFQVSCFEMGFRDEINLILTRIFEIENSRYALASLTFVFLSSFRKYFLGKIGFCQYWTILDWPEALDSKIQSGENGSMEDITLKFTMKKNHREIIKKSPRNPQKITQK